MPTHYCTHIYPAIGGFVVEVHHHDPNQTGSGAKEMAMLNQALPQIMNMVDRVNRGEDPNSKESFEPTGEGLCGRYVFTDPAAMKKFISEIYAH